MKALNKESKISYLHIVIALVIGIILKLTIPATRGLTELGVSAIAIFIPLVYMWVFVSTDWPNFVALGLILMAGIYTPSELYSAVLGNLLCFLVIGTFALSQTLRDTGVINTIVKWTMSRKFLSGRPYVFLATLCGVCTFLSIIMGVDCLTLVFLAFIAETCKNIGYEKSDPFYKALVLIVFWTTNIFNCASPIGGHVLPIQMIAVLASAGYEVTLGEYMKIGVPCGIVATILLIVFICLIWRPEASKFVNYDVSAQKIEPLTKQGKITLGVTIFIILYWLLPTLFPGMLPDRLYSAYKTFGSMFPLFFAIPMLCIIRVDNQPITTFGKATANCVQGIMLFIGTVMMFSGVISSETTGVSIFLRSLLEPLTSGLSPYAILIIFLAVGILLTNITSNTVVMFLIFALASPILANTSIPMPFVGVMIAICAGFGSLLPSAGLTCPYYYVSLDGDGGPGSITVKGTFKQNLIAIAITWAALALICTPLYMLIIG